MHRILLSGLLVALEAARAAGPPPARPAWGGIAAAPALTELSLGTEGLPPGRLLLTTTSGSPRVVLAVAEEARRTGRVAFPVPVPPTGELTVLAAAGGAPPVEIRAALHTGSPPVVAVGGAARALAERPGLIAIPPSELPASLAAYAHLRAIAIDGDSFGRIGEGQLGALYGFIGNCGRVLLVDVEPAVSALLADGAGCRARFLAAAAGGGASAALEQLLAEAPRTLPGPGTLRTLLAGAGGDLELMAFLLAGSLAVFLLLNFVPGARRAAMASCLVACALPALLWPGGSRGQFVAWAEVSADGNRARFSSIEVATSSGRGQATLEPAGLASSLRSIAGRGLTLHWSPEPGERRLTWSTSLLQQARLYATGSFPVTEGLRAAVAGSRVVVCNRGGGAAAGAYLHWQGATWALPALAPGETWTVADEPPVPATDAALRLFERRAPPGVPSLLQPLPVPGSAPDRRAWLMRTEPAEHEAIPCVG